MAFTTTYRHSPTAVVRGREVDVNFDALGAYVDSTFVPAAGGTMSGDLNMGGNDITNLASINSTFIGLGRNRIINGNMRVDQRNEGASVTINSATAAYTLDRWAGVGASADGVFTVIRSTSTPPTDFTNFLRVTVTTADASIGTSQFYSVYQRVEGTNVYDWNLGSSSAVSLTLSFYVRSSLTGTFSGALQNSAQNRSYPFSYTINAANTWERKTVSLTGDTTGTWLATTGIGIGVYFDLGSGSTVRGTAATWAASTYYGVTSASSVIATLNATWDLTGVQFEVGSTATAFEHHTDAINYIFCQRYYEKSYEIGTVAGTSTANGATNFWPSSGSFGGGYASDRSFKVVKRAAPTMTPYSTTGASGNIRDLNAGTDAASSINGGSSKSTGTGSKNSGNWTDGNPCAFQWTAVAEL